MTAVPEPCDWPDGAQLEFDFFSATVTEPAPPAAPLPAPSPVGTRRYIWHAKFLLMRVALPDRETRARMTSAELADAMTSLADARIGLNLARGVAIDDIDPATGNDLSPRAYEESRKSWQYHARMHGLTDQTRRWCEEVRANWLRRRPEYVAADDWAAALLADAGELDRQLAAADQAADEQAFRDRHRLPPPPRPVHKITPSEEYL